MARPRTGETPVRHIRIDDERWGKVKKAAEEDNTTSTEIVKRAIDEHLDRRGK
jgi:predicted transcriptional regulator